MYPGNWAECFTLRGFPGGIVVKNPPVIAGDTGEAGSIPGSGGNGNPLLFLHGESHGQRRLAGCSPWDHKELDMNERVTLPLLCP